MTSSHGYYPFFDYSAIADPAVIYHIRPSPPQYPPNTIMAILHQDHPRMATIVRAAALDWHLADLQTRMTFFVPAEESIPDKPLDRESARNFVKYHMCTGVFPEAVLSTSVLYFLKTSLKSHDVRVEKIKNRLYFNSIPVLSYDHYAVNGILHILQKPYSRLEDAACL
jgi:hypothetical protein